MSQDVEASPHVCMQPDRVLVQSTHISLYEVTYPH